MKKFFKIFNNELGITAVELMVSAALMGGIALFVTQTLKNQKNVSNDVERRLVLEQATKSISDLFKKQDICQQTIGQFDVNDLQSGISLASASELIAAETAGVVIDGTDGFDKDKGQGMRALSKIMASAVSRAGEGNVAANGGIKLKDVKLAISGNIQKQTVTVDMIFEVKSKKKNEGWVEQTQSFNFNVFVEPSLSIKCNQYDDIAIANNSIDKICDELGGVVSLSTGKCEVSTLNEELAEAIRKTVCKSLDEGNSSNYDTSTKKCKNLTLNSVDLKNISSWFVDLGDGKRVEFDKTACPSGEYLQGFKTDGEKICKPIPAPTFGAIDSSLGCTKPTEYLLSADKKSCVKTTYDSACNPQTSTETAGTCQVFADGSCTQYTEGSIISSTEGECGSTTPVDVCADTDPANVTCGEEVVPGEPSCGVGTMNCPAGICADGSNPVDSCPAGSTCSTINLKEDGSTCTPTSSSEDVNTWVYSSTSQGPQNYIKSERNCEAWYTASTAGIKSGNVTRLKDQTCSSPGTVKRGCSSISGSDGASYITLQQVECKTTGSSSSTSTCPVQKYCVDTTPSGPQYLCPDGSAAQDTQCTNCVATYFNNDGSTCTPTVVTTTSCSPDVVKTEITMEAWTAGSGGGSSVCGNLNNLSCTESGEVQGTVKPYCVSVGNYRRAANPKYYQLSCDCTTSSSTINTCAQTKYCPSSGSTTSCTWSLGAATNVTYGGIQGCSTMAGRACTCGSAQQICSQQTARGGSNYIISCTSSESTGSGSSGTGSAGGEFPGGRIPEEMKAK